MSDEEIENESAEVSESSSNKVELTLQDYIDLREQASSKSMWPALIAATGTALSAIVTAVAAILIRTGS